MKAIIPSKNWQKVWIFVNKSVTLQRKVVHKSVLFQIKVVHKSVLIYGKGYI